MQNDYFDLLVQGEEVLLRTKKVGFPLKSFDLVTRDHPRIKINSFPTLRIALTEIDSEHVIGSWLPLIEVTVSADKMNAYLIMNASQKELDDNKQELLLQAEKVLDEKGVIYGRTYLEGEIFTLGEPMIAATGTPSQEGSAAIITYIDLPEKKPVIREDGSADYYEMNFVTPVKVGEWLGEKIPAQYGIEGSDVFGNSLPALKGLDAKLVYDRKTVKEEVGEDKIVLRAIYDGALEFTIGVVGVGKQLNVIGDVGPETGSITFDGSVSISGTVLAGFSVVATGDISVEGKEGVTNAKLIQSSAGDVYIKGGFFGGGSSIIKAKGTIFIKHANNCKMYGKEVHVGLYLLGTDVISECVFVNKNRGKIIGGQIEALFTIETAFAGNSHERTTILQATGIKMDSLNTKIQDMAKDLQGHQGILGKLEKQALGFEKTAANLTGHQARVYEQLVKEIKLNKETISELNAKIQHDLRTKKKAVQAQINVTKEAYPGTIIQIGSKTSTLHNSAKGIFKIVDGVLNV